MVKEEVVAVLVVVLRATVVWFNVLGDEDKV